MGLVQRAVENAGIATISITHLKDLTEKVNPPRALWLKFPLGRSFGPAGRGDLQRKILTDMLEKLPTFTEDGERIVQLPYRWRRD